MTSGCGSIYIPKDIIFENLLRKEFHNDYFEKIIFYDACVVAKNGKHYGKIIICHDSIYSYNNALNKFTLAAHYKDIYSVEIINDLPDFIFGNLKDKNIHIRVKFYRKDPIKENILPNTAKHQFSGVINQTKESQIKNGKGDNNNNSNILIESSKRNSNLGSNHLGSTIENYKIVEDSIDFFIFNLYSMAFHLLKRSRIDYLIRETVSSPELYSPSSLYLSEPLINRLFDNLLLDMTSSKQSLSILNNYLLELLESGLKYTRIKILFWSKQYFFQFMVTLFTGNLDRLRGIGYDSKIKTSHESKTKTIFSYINCFNVMLQVFNTFCFETDHISSKCDQLRIDNGKWALSLIEGVLSLVGYLNESDQNDELEYETSDLDVELDCVKHSVTIGSIQLFYHMICSSELCICNHDDDPFTTPKIMRNLEKLITYNSKDGFFNRFLNQSLRMQFIWIFPKIFNFEERNLTGEQIVTIYQFFKSMRTIVQCVPKMSVLFRQEMKEEFDHFILDDLLFPGDNPLSSLTLKLLRNFQKNMLDTKNVFTDYY